jgi:hypothetical protein
MATLVDVRDCNHLLVALKTSQSVKKVDVGRVSVLQIREKTERIVRDSDKFRP